MKIHTMYQELMILGPKVANMQNKLALQPL